MEGASVDQAALALMRFYLDEDLPPIVAVIARSFGVDAVSVHESNRRSLKDDVQLVLAAQDQRCLVTRNARDFRPITLRFQEAGYAHSGVLLVPASLPNRQYAAMAAALVQYDREHPDGLPAYMVDYLRPARGDP